MYILLLLLLLILNKSFIFIYMFIQLINKQIKLIKYIKS